MKEQIEKKILDGMFQVADHLLKTSPELNAMLDACNSEEEKNIKLAIAVVHTILKDKKPLQAI